MGLALSKLKMEGAPRRVVEILKAKKKRAADMPETVSRCTARVTPY